MTLPNCLNTLLQRLIRDESGNMTIFSVFILLLIFTVTGASVDIMRFEATRTVMQSTLDRAVLAAADLDQMQDSETVVRDYLEKAGIAATLDSVTPEEGVNYRTVTASGSTDINTFFLRMSGIDTLTAAALATAEEKISNVEISLVLDVSGSMRWNSRMDKLKPAAEAFVDKVMTDDSNGVTTLNVVPFAGQVNPGDILFDYFRGERPKIKHDNNGWGNGDQDAPGGSLCNNNAENADEGAADPSCTDGTTDTTTSDSTTTDPVVTAPVEDYFPPWSHTITNVVLYFDTDGDNIYNVAHRITYFPDSAPKDMDDFYKGAVAALYYYDGSLTDPSQFLGMSIKGPGSKTNYFQVKGDLNGPESDIGPTLNNTKDHKLPGYSMPYFWVDWASFEPEYVSPNPEPTPAPEPDPTTDPGTETPPAEETNVNMPSSCVEIYSDEFLTTAMPTSTDYVPHFNYWAFDEPTMDWGWCPSEEMAIQYYSADRTGLKNFINGMRLHDGTGLQYGMKYGLALLDPANQPALSELIAAGKVDARFEGRPIAWEDPETEKYIILMTDGQTTDQWRPTDAKNPRNGDTVLVDQGAGKSYNLSDAPTNVANLHAQCDLANAKGVTIFAIAFETDTAAANELAYCASSASHFFHVTGDQIFDTFDTIARQINNLRLIQ
ncbi:TadE/TadG family type IV pilus assembly protein [Sagittula sp. MA-2]|jgi:Flp pilus assembly protein TadG|uniref:TadE/TadG family type IV pilus assembly protein n=1 Tax=Sagittula sp. MA-2 TaxID=3048007 RepID=UPI0024C38E6C|nr:TadE/TadG family type IV pilus assembly protein [Sagittula sp. MA-2]WHZ36365.1 pilus assembly protein TadG-related protein [Sagittula sp. MA-2]